MVAANDDSVPSNSANVMQAGGWKWGPKQESQTFRSIWEETWSYHQVSNYISLHILYVYDLFTILHMLRLYRYLHLYILDPAPPQTLDKCSFLRASFYNLKCRLLVGKHVAFAP